jgi:hypothetical protein
LLENRCRLCLPYGLFGLLAINLEEESVPWDFEQAIPSVLIFDDAETIIKTSSKASLFLQFRTPT